MLTALSIRDIVLIRTLDIEFGNGLAVLSGETGAGKSILLDSLSLALGARGDGDLVRVGQDQGQVTAIFNVPDQHPLLGWLADSGLPSDAGEVILRRLQGGDGRTRAYINDSPVSAAKLRDAGRQLVEIHGQHDERAMVDPAVHRELVDAFGGLSSQVEAVEEAHEEWQQAARELDLLRKAIEQAQRDADYLRSSVEELTLLDPSEGEEEELAGRRQTMMAAERIASDIDEAYQVVSGPASPVPTLGSVLRMLERKGEGAPGLLDGAVQHLGAAIDALAGAEAELERALRLSEFDPAELERAEERLFALRAASRKYHVPVEELADHAAKLADQLSALDAGEENLAVLEEKVGECRKVLEHRARELSDARREAGDLLARRVMDELPALKLDKARFFVDQTIAADAITAAGWDTIEFCVQTNPTTRPGPLMKVASGGELSRFLLALKVALADRGSAPTLVFDEIDTGAGGAVADAIGSRLARLAEKVQVLSVTHAPQVAARADQHFLISKTGTDTVETQVSAVAGEERREEIARMLSGAEVTSEARAAADRLMMTG